MGTKKGQRRKTARRAYRTIGGRRHTKKSMWGSKRDAQMSAKRQRKAGQYARVLKVKNKVGKTVYAVYSTDSRNRRRK